MGKIYRKNVTLLRIVRSGPILSTRAGNSEVNRPMWPDFQRIRDFMAVLVTCKFDDDLIKHEAAIMSTTFSPLQVYGKTYRRSIASYSKAKSPIRYRVHNIFSIISLWENPRRSVA